MRKMEKKIFDIEKRTYKYALDVINALEIMPRDNVSQTLGNQLLRSGTSVGANVAEAQTAGSRKDFANYYRYALKSANESKFWLNLLRDTRKMPANKIEPILNETSEICRILASSILSLKKVLPLFLITFSLLLSFSFTQFAYANNIRVENVSLYKSASQPAGTVDVKFDVTWDNSNADEAGGPTDANSQHYFDRAWIFVKFWDTTAMGPSSTGGTGGAYPWGHAILTSGGTLSAYNSATRTGVTSDGIGAFAKPGTNQTVRWNYAGTLIPGAASTYVASTDTIKVRVMAIEMIRIPQGQFYLGDGTTNTVQGQFCTYNSTTTPFTLSGEGALTLGGSGAGALRNNNATGMGTADDFNNTTSQTLPAAFPKGYNALYIMKYDITESQYVLFLNSLTRKQQINRVNAVISGTTPPSNIYVMSNTATILNRNTITFSTPAPSDTTTPYTFTTTRPYRTCNGLNWMDVCAYADWAGLRPMTELEYEKACRGGSATNNTAIDEAAWGQSITNGTSNITAATTISGTEDGTETITNSGANCNYNNQTFTGGEAGQGPLRAGIFAKSATTRAQAGSSYYGVMELSGNLLKRCVTVGNATGRNFTGSHGNGILTLNTTSNTYDGNATNTDWPGIDATTAYGVTGATGSGYRGGNWYYNWSYARVSDRYWAAIVNTGRSIYNGGRCVRGE